MPGITPRSPMPIYGQITSADDVEGNFGPQYVVHIHQVNPNAMTERTVFFPASDDANSKWMRFVASVRKFVELKTIEDMYGPWFEVTDIPGKPFTVKETGEEKIPMQPTVTAKFDSEADCLEAWKKAAAEHGIDPNAAPIAPTAGQAQAASKQTPAKPTIDPGTVTLMKGLYGMSGGDANFLATVANMGYAGDAGLALLAAVKA